MRNLLIVGAVGLLGMASQAFAGTASGTLDVTMTVANNCTLASGGGKEQNNLAGGAGSNGVLDFGSQDAGVNDLPIDGSSAGAFGGDIVLNCTGDTLSPQISFDAGTNANGNQRQLIYSDGITTSLVQYDLYIDSGRANPLLPNQFYDLVPDALATGLKAGTNVITLYARIPPKQKLVGTGVSSYKDTVGFQVTY